MDDKVDFEKVLDNALNSGVKLTSLKDEHHGEVIKGKADKSDSEQAEEIEDQLKVLQGIQDRAAQEDLEAFTALTAETADEVVEGVLEEPEEPEEPEAHKPSQTWLTSTRLALEMLDSNLLLEDAVEDQVAKIRNWTDDAVVAMRKNIQDMPPQMKKFAEENAAKNSGNNGKSKIEKVISTSARTLLKGLDKQFANVKGEFLYQEVEMEKQKRYLAEGTGSVSEFSKTMQEYLEKEREVKILEKIYNAIYQYFDSCSLDLDEVVLVVSKETEHLSTILAKTLFPSEYQKDLKRTQIMKRTAMLNCETPFRRAESKN